MRKGSETPAFEDRNPNETIPNAQEPKTPQEISRQKNKNQIKTTYTSICPLSTPCINRNSPGRLGLLVFSDLLANNDAYQSPMQVSFGPFDLPASTILEVGA